MTTTQRPYLSTAALSRLAQDVRALDEPPLILVAEEDAEYAAIISELLRHASFRVVAEDSASMALRTAELRGPDIAIVSVMLSKGLGIELGMKLQDRDPDLPVIFTTTHDRQPELVAAFDAGAADYIRKPFHPSEFMARVEAIAARRRTALLLQSDRYAADVRRAA